MKRFHGLLILALMLITLPFAGCREVAIPPAGSYSEVLLVTEDGVDDPWAQRLIPIITNEKDYHISLEPAFRVSVVKASDLEDFPTVKNVVICGPMDSSSDVGSKIMGLIGEAGAARVARGRATILKKENLPSPGQLTVVITARDDEELAAVIDEREAEIPEIIEASCRERLRRNLLTSRNVDLETDFQRKYGFILDIPSLYVLWSEEQKPPGVELLREPPTRILGVFWVDMDEAPTIYEPEVLFDIRADYVWKRYDHDKMDRDKVDYSYVRLGEQEAIRMAGYWYNDKATAGGYFQTYYVYDEEEKLLWAVDCLVYAPGRPKHELVRELRCIAETFRTN